jgi:gamma-glutamyl hercynylcysteine S-oxide synthase
MSLQMSKESPPARKRKATPWFRWRSPSRPDERAGSPPEAGSAGPTPEGEAVGRFVGELVAQGRFAFALLKTAEDHVADRDAIPAWKAIERQMALVPFGQVVVVQNNGSQVLCDVPALFIDRSSVTNQNFQQFVAAGCYDSLELWPREVWPSLMQFTDRTGQPGPAGWSGGRFPQGKADHPVAGVSWYEASAYARWVGKRLATAAEWQKAGGWPEHLGGGSCTRYPWGDLFDPSRANLWPSGHGETVPVTEFMRGDTPNGIHQMTGNVWEWLEDALDTIPCREHEVFRPWKPMRRIVGGAFDTYLLNEATCHFVTGQMELDRRDNLGFRCALTVDRLRPAPRSL